MEHRKQLIWITLTICLAMAGCGDLLNINNLTLSVAEDITAGNFSSRFFKANKDAKGILVESYITPTTLSKTRILGVDKDIFTQNTDFEEVAYEMAKGLSNIAKANISVSITGLAGSDIPTANDGSYHACIIINYNNKEYIHVHEALHNSELFLHNHIFRQ